MLVYTVNQISRKLNINGDLVRELLHQNLIEEIDYEWRKNKLFIFKTGFDIIKYNCK